MFLESSLAAFAANIGSMMVQAVGKRRGEKFKSPEMREAVHRCVKDGIHALISQATDDSADTRHKLTDFAGDYFSNRNVARELSKMLRGKQPEIEELEILLEEECKYKKDNLPCLEFEAGMEAFIAAFLESALFEPDLNQVIQAGELIKQSRFQAEMLAEIRELVKQLREKEPLPYALPPVAKIEEQHYLKTLIADCDALNLAAIDETRGADDRVRISDVFTTLNLKGIERLPEQSVSDAILKPRSQSPERAREKEEKPLPIQAIEAVGGLDRLVILGQPGGGKTTLVNYIVTQLARKRRGEGISSESLPGWNPDESPLPVRILLRRLSADIPPGTPKGEVGLIWDHLNNQLKAAGCESAFDAIRQTLIREGGVIFFDGLDEVMQTAEDPKRTLVKDAILQFSGQFENCTIVLTSREYAYRKSETWRLPSGIFPVVELNLFNMEQIEAFTRTWYQLKGRQGDPGKDKAEAGNLFAGIKKFPHLRDLAQYPLLLTLMAQVHATIGYLPENRADLYERSVNLLLAHWDNRIIRDVQGGGQTEKEGLIMRLGVPRKTLRDALEQVAYTAHEKQEKLTDQREGCADIAWGDLLTELEKGLDNDLNKARLVIEYIHERAGLLHALEEYRTYAFPHRTFQEYLTASHIMAKSDFHTRLKKRVLRDRVWWQEVFLLAAGYSRKFPLYVSNLVSALIPKDPGDADVGNVSPEKANLARLAGRTLAETEFYKHVEAEKESEPGIYTTTYKRIQAWLVESLGSDGKVEARERAESGRVLAQLGDPRKEVITLEHMEFCLVPAGPFVMGSDDGGDKEKPAHTNEHLNYDYWISRHPITNAQFEAFVKAGGYGERRYWEAAEKAGYWESGNFKGYNTWPRNFGSRFHLANQPVVWVNWYEVLAFTQWLSEQWREQGILDENWRICLPSEAEWEKAAKGGIEIPKAPVWRQARDKAWATSKITEFKENWERKYPWGDTPDTEKANYDDTGIGAPSALGCFLSGASPYGCLDMAGNVWEWTRSLWGEDIGKPAFTYPYSDIKNRENILAISKILRVMRGGSFDYNSDDMRCAFRGRNHPIARDLYRGFRCVCAPNL